MYRGDDFELFFRVRASDSSYVNFTGCTGRSQLRARDDASVVAAEFDVECTATGIYVRLDEADSAGLAAGDGVMDVEITHPDGKRVTYLRSRVDILQDVTR